MRKVIANIMVAIVAVFHTQPAFSEEPVKLDVGYIENWPLPMLAAKASGAYEEALGTGINWTGYESSAALNEAMAAGEIQISVGQGVPPFLLAVAGGQDIQVLDIAVSYSDSDNCVLRSGLKIDKSNAKELEGKKAAVPLGTTTHYGFILQMKHFDIDPEKLEVLDMSPANAALALEKGDVDLACSFGTSLNQMKKRGKVLLSGDEKEALGILVFDVTSAKAGFVNEYPELVGKFLSVTAKANETWNSGKSRDDMVAAVAAETGMDFDDTKASMAVMKFPDTKEQLSENWLGGGVQKFLAGVAQTYKDAASLDKLLDDYSGVVNKAPLEKLGKTQKD